MSDIPPTSDQQLETDSDESDIERGLPKPGAPTPPAPGGSTDPQVPDNSGMTPDQDAIGSG